MILENDPQIIKSHGKLSGLKKKKKYQSWKSVSSLTKNNLVYLLKKIGQNYIKNKQITDGAVLSSSDINLFDAICPDIVQFFLTFSSKESNFIFVCNLVVEFHFRKSIWNLISRQGLKI